MFLRLGRMAHIHIMGSYYLIARETELWNKDMDANKQISRN